MTADVTLTRPETTIMTALWQKLTFSGAMKLLGLAGVVLGVIQGFKEPSFVVGVQDIKLWIAIVMALQGFLGKSNTAHGTSDNPITPQAAAVVAAAIPSLPAITPTVPSSFVGALITGSMFTVLPDDPNRDGALVSSDPRGTFQKHIIGPTAYYEKLASGSVPK